MSDLPSLTPKERRRAYWHAIFNEHGWVRLLLTTNFHPVGRQAYRSGQLPPWVLVSRIRRHGLRTVINLRDPDSPALALERELCAEEGVRHIDLELYSRDTQSPEVLFEAKRLLQEIEYPALFHCMSGADRAGFMATLYLHWIENVPIEETHQLKLWPYWHYRYARTGVLDYFFDSYLSAKRKSGISLDDWIREEYDHKAMRTHFRSIPWINLLVDNVLHRE